MGGPAILKSAIVLTRTEQEYHVCRAIVDLDDRAVEMQPRHALIFDCTMINTDIRNRTRSNSCTLLFGAHEHNKSIMFATLVNT